MSTLTVLPSGKTYTFAAGATLLQTLIDAGEQIAKKCDGNAKCGSCHVFIPEGRKSISRIQKIENEKLDSMVGISGKSRLACQAVLGEEDVTVELLSFV